MAGSPHAHSHGAGEHHHSHHLFPAHGEPDPESAGADLGGHRGGSDASTGFAYTAEKRKAQLGVTVLGQSVNLLTLAEGATLRKGLALVGGAALLLLVAGPTRNG